MTINTDYTTDTFTSSNGTIFFANNTTTTGNIVTASNLVARNINISGSINSQSIRINTYTSNLDYVLTPQDSGSTIYFNNNLSTFVNVGTNLFPGFRVILTSINTGLVTIRTSTSNATIHPRTGTGNQITGTYASASLVCYASNNYILDGSIQ